MNLTPGIVIGHYRILSYLGEGRMSKVYLAEDVRLKRPITLKLLSAPAAEEGREILARSALAAARLNHPNIVATYEYGLIEREQQPTFYIVTEFISGATLREQIRSARKPISEVINLGIQTATALDAAHRLGVVHHDLKPENIILNHDGLVKITDFGLARRSEIEPTASEEDEPKVNVISSLPYMSPEQLLGGQVGVQTDIWSLGAVLYETVTGRVAFKGKTKSDTVFAILEKDPEPLTAIVSGVPDEFERIVNIALRKSAPERYQSARKMVEDLRSLQQRLATVAAHVRVAAREDIRGEALFREDETKSKPAEQEVVELEADSLYVNLWIEDERQEMLSTPATLEAGTAYQFLFAVEPFSREQAQESAPFDEPEVLKRTPKTKVIVEVLCPFLEDADDGYARREVEYYAGRGFPPEAFALKPEGTGRFNLTARLIFKGETMFREVLGLEVVPQPAAART
jgi:serine/threonine protein kinase